MKQLCYIPFAYLVSLASFHLHAQQPPATALFSFDVVMRGDSIIALDHPECLSGDNLASYNNQPAFLNDQEILASVQKEDANQTDIYAFNLRTHTRRQLTDTKNFREYSPTPLPDRTMSLIRQDTAGKQQLWIYPLEADGKPKQLLSGFDAIGYHCWMTDSSLVLFEVGNPNVLQWVHLDGSKSTFASDAGRCLQKLDNTLLYVHKFSDQYWFIKRYDPVDRRAQIVTETLSGSEDFVLAGKQRLVMAKGSSIYQFNLSHPSGWHLIQDLAPYGITHITRLAYRNDKLILVDNQ